jgi:hypothetical protein
MNPALRIAMFFASAVSMAELAILPACPNCTSVANILAQVPIAHATIGFLMMPFLDGVDDAVFFDTTDLAEEDEHLALRILFVTQEMVDECRAGVTITTDGDTLVSTIGDKRRMLLSSLDMPPDLETYPTEPARYSLEEMMLSIILQWKSTNSNKEIHH